MCSFKRQTSTKICCVAGEHCCTASTYTYSRLIDIQKTKEGKRPERRSSKGSEDS